MNIDTLEVLKAASTKWNFLKFYPGLVGGHCISVDPYYLTYKAKKIGYKPKLILAGRKINDQMSQNIVSEINNKIKLNFSNKKIKILLMGLTFKENCSDLRNSQVLNIYNKLKGKNLVDIYDPNAEKNEVKKYFNIFPKKNLKDNYYDLVVIAVGHKQFKENATGLSVAESLILENGVFSERNNFSLGIPFILKEQLLVSDSKSSISGGIISFRLFKSESLL